MVEIQEKSWSPERFSLPAIRGVLNASTKLIYREFSSCKKNPHTLQHKIFQITAQLINYVLVFIKVTWVAYPSVRISPSRQIQFAESDRRRHRGGLIERLIPTSRQWLIAADSRKLQFRSLTNFYLAIVTQECQSRSDLSVRSSLVSPSCDFYHNLITVRQKPDSDCCWKLVSLLLQQHFTAATRCKYPIHYCRMEEHRKPDFT